VTTPADGLDQQTAHTVKCTAGKMVSDSEGGTSGNWEHLSPVIHRVKWRPCAEPYSIYTHTQRLPTATMTPLNSRLFVCSSISFD
jgi:hypothetical protein